MSDSMTARVRRGRQQHGSKFDESSLMAAHPSVRDAFESGLRVKIRTRYAGGEEHVRTGRVSTTTGWRPAFILLARADSSGSSDVLGRHDEVIGTQRGRTYDDRTPYGRTYEPAPAYGA